MKNTNLSELAHYMVNLQEDKLIELLDSYISSGMKPEKIIAELSMGMEEVGRLFKEEKYFLSELVYSGNIFKDAMAKLTPLFKTSDTSVRSNGKVVVGTVKDDIHDLGKDIVVTMLECASFEVVDLGVDVPAEKFVDAIKTSGASLVGMSVLLTTAFKSLNSTIDAICEAGLRKDVKIMVGGGCITEKLVMEMEADFYGQDAVQAVDIAKGINQ